MYIVYVCMCMYICMYMYAYMYTCILYTVYLYISYIINIVLVPQLLNNLSRRWLDLTTLGSRDKHFYVPERDIMHFTDSP